MKTLQPLWLYRALVLLMIPMLVLFMPLIGNHSGSGVSQESPSAKPDEEWVRRDSIESVLIRLCTIRLINTYTLQSRAGRWLADVPTNDVSKFLGSDFKNLQKASNNDWVLELKSGQGFTLECRLRRFDGVEYVRMPLDILYAIAENLSSMNK